MNGANMKISKIVTFQQAVVYNAHIIEAES